MVTEAKLSRSAEINQRERRYLVMMGIRVICFGLAIVMFVYHAGWFALIPAAGAILLPYFAVVVANARQESTSTGFRPYQPRLPERFDPTVATGNGQPGAGGSTAGQARSDGAATDGNGSPANGGASDAGSTPSAKPGSADAGGSAS